MARQELSFKVVAIVAGAVLAVLLVEGMLRVIYTAARGPAVPESPATAADPGPSAPWRADSPVGDGRGTGSARAGKAATVTKVIDGDTFETSDGWTVRVLGIDSCEAGTHGGTLATVAARQMLIGGDVTLAREPGVSTDQYGRLLRYVSVNGVDFGQMMVAEDHTAVYEGRNDANPVYVAELRNADANGRTCEASSVYVPPAPHRPYVPAPDRSSGDDSRRTGNSGHPCLPWERDGDNDGYCKEGR